MSYSLRTCHRQSIWDAKRSQGLLDPRRQQLRLGERFLGSERSSARLAESTPHSSRSVQIDFAGGDFQEMRRSSEPQLEEKECLVDPVQTRSGCAL